MGLIRDRILTQTYGVDDGSWTRSTRRSSHPGAALLGHRRQRPGRPVHPDLHERRARPPTSAAAYRFAQTILTLALLAMVVVAVVLFVMAPWTVDDRRPRIRAESSAPCTSSCSGSATCQPGPVRRVDGPRRGPRRPSADSSSTRLHRSCTTPGIVVGTAGPAPTIGIQAAAVGAVLGASLPWASAPGRRPSRTTVPAPAAPGRCGTAALREFFRLMLPKTAVESARADHLPVLHERGLEARRRQHHHRQPGAQLPSVPVSLIGVAFSIAAFPVLAAAYAAATGAGSSGLVGSNGRTIGVLTIVARRSVSSSSVRSPSRSCWAAVDSTPRPSPGPRACWLSSPSPSRSRASAT